MGAPIYLVSACASGEEFVAAFRRYADKNGLFIPIAEPLPPGSRSRFALTLRDGGVMIEGEAEIVSSARAPSVVHGRVGMTLRFVEPDEPSRTTIGELERARLAMKPPPPSMPPRPAEVPAEPRPVPPPLQGRIDAVNALAECVAIGDVAALGPPLPPLAPAPARAGTRSSLPPIPSRGAPTTPPAGLGVAQRTASAARPSTAPLPIVLARAEAAAPAELPITPRATPQPDRLRNDRAPAEPGPGSDTMVAATPPPTSRTETLRGPHSATMTAVPVPTNGQSSAPTEIGGPLVVPIDPDDDPSARTQIHAGAPSRAAEVTPTEPGEPVGERARPVPSPPVTVHGMTPILRPPAAATATLPMAPMMSAMPAMHDVEIGEPTDISMPPEPPSSPSLQLPVETGPVTDPDADLLSADADAGARSTVPEVRVVASESGAVSAEAVTLSAESSTLSPEAGLVAGDAAGGESEAVTHEFVTEPPLDDAPGKPRRTVLGVAVGPDGAMVLPAPGHREAELDEDRNTRPVLRSAGDATVDPGAPTVPPGAQLLAAAEQLMPSRVWVPDDGEESPEPRKPPQPPAPAGSNSGLPSGDWMIALDPNAPDGWSAPFHTIPPEQAFDGPPSLPSALAAGRGSPPPGAAAAAMPVTSPTSPTMPAALPPTMPAAAAAQPAAGAQRPSPRPQELPIVEPKVQIDPTLVEPARGAVPAATASSPELPPMMPAYTGTEGFEAPALQMMMAVPQPAPFAHGPPQPLHGSQPAYPLDPSYQDPGYADPGYADPSYTEPSYGGETSYSDPSYQMMQPVQAPGMFAGYGDPRYAHSRTLPPRNRRRHLVIVLITAVVAVLVGITVMLILRTRHEAAPAPSAEAVPAPSSEAAPPSPTGEPAPPAAAGLAAVPLAAPAAAAPAAAPPPAPAECFADVTSQPPGADIVIDQNNVIGTTPQRVQLPCGAPVEVVVRKAHLAPAAKTITPTPEGAPLQVALARQLVTVKVSSTPAGATVTLGGKSLGVTPTVVKVPAFEASMLTIAKDGYEPDTEKVAPKASGAAVHSVLKKLERKKPR